MRFTMKAAKNKLKIGAFWTSKKCDMKTNLTKVQHNINVFILLCKSAFSVYSLQPMYTFLGNEQVENL